MSTNSSLWRTIRHAPGSIWFLAVFVIALAQRVSLWLAYPVVSTNDSPSYIQLARSLINRGFTEYACTRTPGYPLFVALHGLNPDSIYLTQLVLGIVVTLLFFYIGFRVTGKPWFGAVVALAHTLNPAQIFAETYVMSETLATLFLISALAVTVLIILERPSPYPLASGLAFAAGLFSSAAIMTRPMFILAPFVLGLGLLIRRGDHPGKLPWRKNSGAALALCLPVILTVGLWVNYVHALYKVWGMDAMGGFHLVNNTGTFFEYVPDEYAEVREIYLQYRAARLADRGTEVNTIWDAIPSLNKALGTNYYSLSRLLTKISLDLIREHPDLYLLNVAKGWWWAWLTPVYWNEAAIANPALRAALASYIYAARALLFGANLVFLTVSVAALAYQRLRAVLQMDAFQWMLVGVVMSSSIVQAFGEHGDNPRFLLPLQSVVVFLVLLWAARLVEALNIKRKPVNAT